MSDKLKLILGGVIFAVVVILFETMFIINQTEQAIVLQFGEPVREIKEAGLKFKIPFIQKVVIYDNRLLNLEPPAQEVVLNDKKRLDVDNFTRYRIVDPLKFYQTVRNEYQARSKLEEIVNSSVRKVLGRITLQELLSSKRTQIMADISKAVKVDAEQIGVMVADVRIRRADLPVEVLQAINARMKTEREREAKEFRATGQQEAQKIRATAEKEQAVIIADAEKQAQIIRGEGDKQAIEIWNNAAGVDADFYSGDVQGHVLKGQVSNQIDSLTSGLQGQASRSMDPEIAPLYRDTNGVLGGEGQAVVADQTNDQITLNVDACRDRLTVDSGQLTSHTLVGKVLQDQLASIEEGKAALGHFARHVALIVQVFSCLQLLVTKDQGEAFLLVVILRKSGNGVIIDSIPSQIEDSACFLVKDQIVGIILRIPNAQLRVKVKVYET